MQSPSIVASEPVADRSIAEEGKRLWFLASLPPPVNGQANCNAAMQTLLSKTLRLMPLSLGRSSLDKIARAFANSWTLLRTAKRDDVVYVSIPGQLGAWLLLPAIAAARLRGATLWFHHHSFRAINLGPMAVMRALVACAGPRQNHILLSDGMRDRFAGLYLRRGAGRAHTMSNTVLFPPDMRVAPAPRPERPPTLGHVSVLTREKGVLYLIDLFDDLRRHIPAIRLVIAGPSSDPALLEAIRAAQARHPDAFEYRGEIAGIEKDRFYSDIDLFVLPTTLIDEAEPLVMIEAYSRGIDVFATATGCIPDRIRDPGFLLSLDRADDADRVAAVAGSVSADWIRQRAACQAHVARLAAKGEEQGTALLDQVRGQVPGSVWQGQTEHGKAALANATKAGAP